MQCQPLYTLLTTFNWANNAEATFQILKTILSNIPTLNYPNYSLPFIVTTDASDDGIGAVLSQISDEGKNQYNSYPVHNNQPKRSGVYVKNKL